MLSSSRTGFADLNANDRLAVSSTARHDGFRSFAGIIKNRRDGGDTVTGVRARSSKAANSTCSQSAVKAQVNVGAVS